MAKQTILLTGATGFLGSHLLEGLLKSGFQVIVLKRSTSNIWRIEHLMRQVKSYDVDVISLNEVFSNNSIDIVIHLATLYRKFDNGSEVNEMVKSNISFPVELLEVGVRHGIKGFINTGTFFEYDCSITPINEEAKINPFNLYAKTKVAFETILATYSNQISIKSLRLFTPYGEKDNNKLIPNLIQKALLNEKIELSDGLQKLDFIYADDIVDAYLKSLNKMEKFNQPNYKIYNIGSGTAVSVRDVVSIIEQQLGISINKVWGKPSPVDIPIAFASIKNAATELGWHPKHSIHQGIAKTISYYKNKAES